MTDQQQAIAASNRKGGRRMSEAPETIWAWWFHETSRNYALKGGWTDEPDRRVTEYRRADLPPTLSAAMELPEVKALVEALARAIGAIDAAYDGPDEHGRYTTRERAALVPFTEAKP